MGSDKYKKLARNSAIFLIGNLGSKVITFLIVPFYTYYLTTAEYGAADLVTTTVNLIAPFAMMGMNEAVLRFSVSREESIGSIASNSMVVVLAGWIVCWASFPLFRTLSVIGDNVIFFLFLLCLGGADKKLDTPVSGLESACTRWRPGSSPWRPSRRGSA